MGAEQWMNRDDAVALHRSGEVAAAITAYKGLLIKDPDDADILGLLGVATEQSGDLAGAETLLRRSLSKPTTTALLYRNFNNLVGLLIEAGREEDAGALAAEIELPDWPSALVPDAVQRDTIVSTVEALKSLDEPAKALRISNSAAPFFSANLVFSTQRAELLHADGQLEKARTELAQDFGPEEESPNLHALRAALAFEAQDYKTSANSTARFASTLPTLLSPRQASQKFVLAILNPAPEVIQELRSTEFLHYSGNFPSQLATEFADRYRFLSIYPDSPTVADALKDLPRPALALNNFVNAEKLLVEGKFAEVCALVDQLSVPVLNHPKLVAQVTRQKNSERFAKVEGIIAPRIVRYQSSKPLRGLLIDDIESRYDYPMILRTVFQQMGKGTWLIHDRKELHEALDATDEQQVYLINYVDLRHENGFFRRIRAAFVNKVWTILRIDYDGYWNVRGRREHHIVEFYRNHPDLMELSDRMTLDPQALLDASALAKLDDIAKIIPLDIFGMDFDITDDGQIAVFEANATMNLLSNAEGGLIYPQEAQRRLTQALHALFERTAVSPI
ncbi:hypothetical protein GCM10007874_72020 [Labrys miyagiensis]|uniref:ATP-grasp domain-containing protein n=1 Tax=Labrys miyagiensis TaxID=346912 RepID=A0ABQ6CV04_9HYPH|nr:hypothetical protein [Labrys miyagiensis]GLS24181.1 hypothetical protein GCM10007874_72020 [Labrys miyagiensis]